MDPQAAVVSGGSSRWSHTQHVQDRLNFLRFLLKDGQLWLCAPQAKQIWSCLAEHAVYLSDREACFKWFSKVFHNLARRYPESADSLNTVNILLHVFKYYF